jgi:hypothetical protein
MVIDRFQRQRFQRVPAQQKTYPAAQRQTDRA